MEPVKLVTAPPDAVGAVGELIVPVYDAPVFKYVAFVVKLGNVIEVVDPDGRR